MIVLLLISAGLAIAVGVINIAVLRAWRQDHRHLAGVAGRLSAEARLQAHTVRSLQDMRAEARHRGPFEDAS